MASVLKRLFSRRPAADEPEIDPLEEGAPAGREGGGLTIGRLVLAAFLLSSAVTAGLGVLAYLQVQGQVENQRRLAVTAQGERLAAEISGRIQGLAEVVENVAAQPALAEALLANDPAALASRAETVASAIPGALLVRFLPLGADQTDETRLPRLGYAGLDLAREAEKGTRPPLEAHWFGQADQHIAMARLIGTPQQPAGVLLAALDLKLLERWLEASLPGGGYAEVRQSTGDTQVLLASRGDTALQGTPATATVKLAGTNWELHYWLPPADAALRDGSQLMFVALFGGAALLQGLVFLFLAGTVGRLVRSDLDGVVRHVFDLLSRKREHGYSVRLRDFRKAVQTLDENVRLPAPAEGARPGAQPEDPMFMHGGNMSVEEMPPQGERKE